MGRLSSDSTAVHSSIALLQERFRKLQRVKEMREERELLRSFAESEQAGPSTSYEQPRWFLHPDLVQPSRPLSGSSKDLRTESHGEHAKLRSFSTTCLSMGLRPDRPNMPSLNNSNEMDVDTSLHL